MKKSFSQVLLCGVIASSIILVNCQKAPNRGIKPQVGAPASPGAATDPSKTVDGKAVVPTVACSVAIIAQRDKSNDLLSKINAIDKVKESNDKLKLKVKSDLTEAEISDLTKLNDDLNLQCNDFTAEFDNQKVESCFEAATKDKKQNNYSKAGINQMCNRISLEISGLTGVTGTRVKERATEIAAEQAKKDSTLEGKKFFVGTDLMSDMLSDKQEATTQYAVSGNILKGSSGFKAAQQEKTNSVCFVSASAGPLDTDQELDYSAVSTVKKDPNSLKSEYVITLVTAKDAFPDGVKTYAVTCLIAEKTKLAEEFKKAFGDNLTLEKSAAGKEADKKAAADKAAADAKTKADADAKVKADADAKATADKAAADKAAADKAVADKAAADQAAADKVAADKAAADKVAADKAAADKLAADEKAKADKAAADKAKTAAKTTGTATAQTTQPATKTSPTSTATDGSQNKVIQSMQRAAADASTANLDFNN